jgi:hypothetical protein
MTFLRFVDLYWLAPAIQGVEAHTSVLSLQKEFWKCMRIFPKEEDKEKYVKNRVSFFFFLLFC